MFSSLSQNIASDTIVAPLTGNVLASIGVVRYSGTKALMIVSHLFVPFNTSLQVEALPDRKLIYGKLVYQDQIIDQVLVTVMRAPKSFTGEDIVEIQCHGNPVILETILAVSLSLGARLAEAGEFTYRAFLNKKMTLLQTEALAKLFESKTQTAVTQSLNHMKSDLYEYIVQYQVQLKSILADLFSILDFTEGGFEQDEEDKVRQHDLKVLASSMEKLLATVNTSLLYSTGFRIALYGEANVGKSSLVNQLVGLDRVIVSSVAGTTRDSIENSFKIKDCPFILVDTAGYMETDNEIEQASIEKTNKEIKKADLVVWVLDSTKPFPKIPVPQVNRLIFIWNKADLITEKPKLPLEYKEYESHLVCALEEDSIQNIKQVLYDQTGMYASETQDITLATLRQKEVLKKAITHVQAAISLGDKQQGEEYMAEEISLALQSLDSLLGQTTADEILDEIFSSFCIGK